MSSSPSGWQTPKKNWDSTGVVLPTDLNRVEGNIDALDNGQRTLDPTQAPTGNVGTLRQLLDWFANRIKAITGATNWYDAPAATLASLLSSLTAHTSRTDNPHQVTAAQVGALVSIDGVSNPGGNVDLVAGANIAITPDDVNNTITIAGTGTWPSAANADTVDSKHASDLLDLAQHTGTISDAQHGSRGGGSLHAVATTSVAGFMSAADKAKLDSIGGGANARVASGSYTGDGTANRTITVGFTPKFVYVSQAYQYDMISGFGHNSSGVPGLSAYDTVNVGPTLVPTTTDAAYRPNITTNGFIVSGNSIGQLNYAGYLYYWTAIG